MNRDSVAAECAASPDIRVNFFERQQAGEYEVGIVEREGVYWVYWSSERASIRAERAFSEEPAALAEFLDILNLEHQRQALFGGGSRP